MIKPLADYILVRPEIKKEHTTESGIILSDADNRDPSKGEIIAVNDLSDMRVGSHVLFKDWAGFEIKHDGEKLILLAEEDILVEFEGEEATV